MGTDERLRRIALNEASFRAANERLEQMNAAFARVGAAELPVVCECGDGACLEQFTVAFDEYRSARADPLQFIVRPGHEIPDAEEVVERQDAYVVVRKRPGAGGRIAHETAGGSPGAGEDTEPT
jgi:hypothetical protein